MSILAEHIAFVNEQIGFHDRQFVKYGKGKTPSEHRQTAHAAVRDKFKVLLTDLLKADTDLDTQDKRQGEFSGPVQLYLDLEELEGLPEELLAELSTAAADKTEFAIVGIIDEAGGVCSMDRLLVGLYRKLGDILRRPTLTSKLYRMSQRGLVFGVPGKKGFYSTRKLTREDVDRLFTDTHSIDMEKEEAS